MNIASSEKILLAVGWLFLSATTALAAEVKYAHPEVSIVASDESLVSVLQSVGKVMEIDVRIPEGVNPLINCDIQAQTIPRAINNLLGDLSYTLSWDEQGERLTGLTILAAGKEQSEKGRGRALASVSTAPAPMARITTSNQSTPQDTGHDARRLPDDPYSDEHSAAMEQEQLEREDRREAERAEQEVAMREERARIKIEQEERDIKERARHKSEFNAYLDSVGVDPKDRPTWLK